MELKIKLETSQREEKRREARRACRWTLASVTTLLESWTCANVSSSSAKSEIKLSWLHFASGSSVTEHFKHVNSCRLSAFICIILLIPEHLAWNKSLQTLRRRRLWLLWTTMLTFDTTSGTVFSRMTVISSLQCRNFRTWIFLYITILQ